MVRSAGDQPSSRFFCIWQQQLLKHAGLCPEAIEEIGSRAPEMPLVHAEIVDPHSTLLRLYALSTGGQFKKPTNQTALEVIAQKRLSKSKQYKPCIDGFIGVPLNVQ